MVVRIAVIGGGKFGTNHLKTFKQLEHMGRVKLVALADINPKVLEEHGRTFGVKGYISYKEMLERENLDAVTVVTPDHLHREIAVDVAEAGKHILVEKPLDVTVEGCTEIIEAARKTDVLLQVDFHKRFDPDHVALKKAIQEGRLGNVEYGYAWMEDTIEVPVKWFPNWAPRSSPAWFLGIHYYDLARWLLSSNARRVYATGIKGKLLGMGIDTYDAIQSKVEFENGASVFFDTSWILPERFEAIVNQGLRLVGSEGFWEVDAQNRGVEACTAMEGMKTLNNHFIMEERDKLDRPVFKGYGIASIEDFIVNLEFLQADYSLQHLAGKYASGEDGREATRVAVAVHRSVKEQAIIPVV